MQTWRKRIVSVVVLINVGVGIAGMVFLGMITGHIPMLPLVFQKKLHVFLKDVVVQEVAWDEEPDIQEKLKFFHATYPGPQVEPYTEMFFPENKGLGQGGTPYMITKNTYDGLHIGFYIGQPDPNQILFINPQKKIVRTQAVQPRVLRYVKDQLPLTKKWAVVLNYDQKPGALDILNAYQIDLQNGTLHGPIARNLNYIMCPAPHPEGKNGIVFFPVDRFMPGINQEAPERTFIRLYSEKYQDGIEIGQFNYFYGRTSQYWWKDEHTLYFSTKVQPLFPLQKATRLFRIKMGY